MRPALGGGGGSGSAAPDLQGSQEPPACARGLFRASECAAARRCSLLVNRRRAGKVLPCPARAPRTPPRGALGLARRDRRDRASPPPVPASASGRGSGVVATPQWLHEESGVGFCLYCTPPFWRRMRRRSGKGVEPSLVAPRKAQEILQAHLPGFFTQGCFQDWPLNISTQGLDGCTSTQPSIHGQVCPTGLELHSCLIRVDQYTGVYPDVRSGVPPWKERLPQGSANTV